MFRVMTAIVVLAGTTLFADDKKELEKISGKWQPTSMQIGKATMPAESLKRISLELDGDKYKVVAESPDKGTVKIDSSAKPKSMDLMGTEGPNKGKKFLCIYELDGEILRICYDLEGKARPKEFKATGDKIMLATYKRVK